MADRFFDNVMPDFVNEKKGTEAGGDSLMNLLTMPYSSLLQQLKRSALDLKETVRANLLLFLVIRVQLGCSEMVITKFCCWSLSGSDGNLGFQWADC